MRRIEQLLMFTLMCSSIVLCGCALTPAHVNLAYAPEAGKKSPLSAVSTLRFALQVDDQRDGSERDRVGDKKNNYGMVTAKVLSKTEPPTVIQNALGRELTHNGHEVVEKQASPDIVVQASLKKYWSDARVRFWDVEMIATLSSDVSILDGRTNRVILSKPLNCTFRDSTPMATDGCHEKVLNGALAEFVRTFARDPAILDAIRSVRPGER